VSPRARRKDVKTRAGSSDLDSTFKSLRGLLRAYRHPMVAKVDSPRRYELWSKKDVVIAGRKRSEVFFAAAIIQKSYVGFYFMPVYAAPEMKRFFAPELLALLKGKSCFHFKTLDAQLRDQVESALAKGFGLYREHGWV